MGPKSLEEIAAGACSAAEALERGMHGIAALSDFRRSIRRGIDECQSWDEPKLEPRWTCVFLLLVLLDDIFNNLALDYGYDDSSLPDLNSFCQSLAAPLREISHVLKCDAQTAEQVWLASVGVIARGYLEQLRLASKRSMGGRSGVRRRQLDAQ